MVKNLGTYKNDLLHVSCVSPRSNTKHTLTYVSRIEHMLDCCIQITTKCVYKQQRKRQRDTEDFHPCVKFHRNDNSDGGTFNGKEQVFRLVAFLLHGALPAVSGPSHFRLP